MVGLSCFLSEIQAQNEASTSWKNTETLKAWSMDSDSTKIWEKEIEQLLNNRQQNMVELRFDANGNAVMLLKDVTGDYLNPSTLTLCVLSSGEEDPLYFPLKHFNQKVEQYRLAYLNPQTLSIVGLFQSEKKSQVGISQFQVCLLNREVKRIPPVYFPSTFKLQSLPLTAEKTKCTVARDRVEVKEVFEKKEGGFLLVGEKIATEGNLDPELLQALGRKTKEKKQSTNYGDILLASFSKEGTLEWTNEIEKRQVSNSELGKFSSFSATLQDDELFIKFDEDLHFIFDNENNLIKNKYRGKANINRIRNSRRPIINQVKIDLSGYANKSHDHFGLADKMQKPVN